MATTNDRAFNHKCARNQNRIGTCTIFWNICGSVLFLLTSDFLPPVAIAVTWRRAEAAWQRAAIYLRAFTDTTPTFPSLSMIVISSLVLGALSVVMGVCSIVLLLTSDILSWFESSIFISFDDGMFLSGSRVTPSFFESISCIESSIIVSLDDGLLHSGFCATPSFLFESISCIKPSIIVSLSIDGSKQMIRLPVNNQPNVQNGSICCFPANRIGLSQQIWCLIGLMGNFVDGISRYALTSLVFAFETHLLLDSFKWATCHAFLCTMPSDLHLGLVDCHGLDDIIVAWLVGWKFWLLSTGWSWCTLSAPNEGPIDPTTTNQMS